MPPQLDTLGGKHFYLVGNGAMLEAARSGRAGNGDPLAVSDLFDLLPAFLSHHPDQDDPAPTHAERPWNRPY